MANIIFSEATGLNKSVYGEVQFPIRQIIEKRGESFEARSCIKDLFGVVKSKHFSEQYSSMTAMDGFKPTVNNGSHPVDGMQESYSKSIQNVTWKNRFDIEREIIDDARTIDLKKKPQQFITSYYRTREKFAAAIYGGAIKLGTSITYEGMNFDIAAADGSALFSKTHPVKVKGSTQSNYFADAFSNDALMAAETAMQSFRGDNNDILDITPDTILIPNLYTLKKSVFAAIGADKDPATANNGFNYNFGRWTVIVWGYLNNYITPGTSPWILLDSQYNDDYSGAIWQDRNPLEVSSSIDNDTNANVWWGYSRFNASFNDWRFAAVGGVASGTTLVTT